MNHIEKSIIIVRHVLRGTDIQFTVEKRGEIEHFTEINDSTQFKLQ